LDGSCIHPQVAGEVVAVSRDWGLFAARLSGSLNTPFQFDDSAEKSGAEEQIP